MERTICLTLKKEPFDQIKAGTKTEEFRVIKSWSTSRFVGKEYDFIEFINGYSKNSRRMIVEYFGYLEKEMVFEGELQKVYALQLGDVIIAD